jgi:hypothetical protein
MDKTKKIQILAIVLIVIALGLFAVRFIKFGPQVVELPRAGSPDKGACPGEKLTLKMQDEHMSGILEKDELYTVTQNYYACNKVAKDDLVLYRFSESLPPVVKTVKAVAGDTFKTNYDKVKRQWSLDINGETVKDVDGQVYYFGNENPTMIGLYEKQLKNTLAEGQLILLSSRPPGNSDSTRFGLANVIDVIGKVEKGGSGSVVEIGLKPMPKFDSVAKPENKPQAPAAPSSPAPAAKKGHKK